MEATVAETDRGVNQARVMRLLKPFVCRKCGSCLGITDGKSLEMGTGSLLGVAAIKCGGCGAIRVWRPMKEGAGRDE